MDKRFIGKRTRRLYAIINATTAIFLVVVGVFFISNFNATSSASDLQTIMIYVILVPWYH